MIGIRVHTIRVLTILLMNIFDLSLISYVICFKNSNLAGLSENISIFG